MLKGVSPWVLRHLVLCQSFCPGVPVRLMTPAPALGPREHIALFLFSQLRSPEVRFPDFSSPSQDWVFFFSLTAGGGVECNPAGVVAGTAAFGRALAGSPHLGYHEVKWIRVYSA